jgi:hypothetical protein
MGTTIRRLLTIKSSRESDLVEKLKRQLPRPIRKPLGHVRRTFEAPFHYLRGKRILADYTKYYRKAQGIFTSEGNAAHLKITPPRNVGVRVVFFGAKRNFINLPTAYLKLVKRVADSVKPLFDLTAECSFFPELQEGPVPERTNDIGAVKNGEIISIQLKNPLVVEGLEDLCAPIVQELENKVYGSYAIVDKVYIYRSPVSRQTRQVSWLWHYDNHPHEVLKVMIYLTDVSDCNAPFEYLRSKGSMTAVSGSPVAPHFSNSRISDDALTRYLSNGAERHRVTGPRGTMIVFDNNMIHRGNLASEGHRDVIIFQFRPVTTKTQPHIDPRWTGSFQHATFNIHPCDLKPSIVKYGRLVSVKKIIRYHLCWAKLDAVQLDDVR